MSCKPWHIDPPGRSSSLPRRLLPFLETMVETPYYLVDHNEFLAPLSGPVSF